LEKLEEKGNGKRVAGKEEEGLRERKENGR
jgi:hypothetical protein